MNPFFRTGLFLIDLVVLFLFLIIQVDDLYLKKRKEEPYFFTIDRKRCGWDFVVQDVW